MHIPSDSVNFLFQISVVQTLTVIRKEELEKRAQHLQELTAKGEEMSAIPSKNEEDIYNQETLNRNQQAISYLDDVLESYSKYYPICFSLSTGITRYKRFAMLETYSANLPKAQSNNY